MIVRVFAVCAALALAAPVFAQATAPAAPATAPTDAPKKEKKICRRDADTGSYIPHTTCHTKEEWQAIDQQNGANFDRLRHNFGHGPSGS